MSNEAQVKAMKLAHQLHNPQLRFKAATLTDLDKFIDTGDVVFITDTNQLYTKTNAGVTLLSSPANTVADAYDYHRYRELDNQVLRCKSCNSALDLLKVDRNNNVTCPYCNSVNHIFEKR